MTSQHILSIFIAAMLGGAIGFEREYRSKEAGFRTHFLVGLGSGLYMILSMYGFDDFVSQPGVIIQRDPARMAAQVVSGIGFIGAGTIIFQKNVVKGLTTAAGLWVTSAIGMTASAGMYAVATAATIMVLVCLEGMNFIHHHIFKHRHQEFDVDDKTDENTNE
jgi:putative Mg2+ transporter-C (MgtC) family protein